MSTLKVVFKNTTNEQKLKFKDMQCLLLISVGQESHEEERFSATIDLVNSSFGSCIILLYDSIQRYSMALNSDKNVNDFHGKAVKQGDLWLNRNKKYYDRLTMLKNISRWDTWIQHHDFLHQRECLLKTIKSDSSYKTIFDSTADNYINRYITRLNDAELITLIGKGQNYYVLIICLKNVLCYVCGQS